MDLALRFIDGSELRGQTIHVEKAAFSLKGEYNPKLRKKISNKQKKKLKAQQEKWVINLLQFTYIRYLLPRLKLLKEDFAMHNLI